LVAALLPLTSAGEEPIHKGRKLSEWIADLKNGDSLDRRAAVYAIGAIGPAAKGAVPALVLLLDDPVPANREVAEEVLRRFGAEGRKAVIAALDDPAPSVRAAAATALGRFWLEAGPAVPALVKLGHDKDPVARKAAITALRRFKAWEVEKYLHSGELAKGEKALGAALAAAPNDDQIRFGLGVLQFVRGVERFGQSLHKYGTKSENTDVPFLRLPVPTNRDPAPVTYADIRRALDDFRGNLAAAEATLAGVKDDEVKLPIRLALVRLDLDGDGQATDKFIDVLTRIMGGQQFDFRQENPDFLVCFDRGDVAWLRAYCHLLMGMLDFYLAFDTERLFDLSADVLFAKPKKRFQGEDAERQKKLEEAFKVFAVKEPARLGRFRKHFIKVAELNREIWKHIRAETDDDHEWLPNPRQKGVLGLPVRDEMIDAWLAMMAELEALLNGKRTLGSGLEKNGKGLNLKTLLDDPPEKVTAEFFKNLPEKYLSEEREVDSRVLDRVARVFGNTTAFAYAAWFN
jgi:hypothetical protein